MKIVKRHPDRVEMIKAIKTGSVTFAKHLEECDQCQEMFGLLSEFSPAPSTGGIGSGGLQEPSLELLYRHRAIARLVETRNPEKKIGGGIAFDSWADLPIVQVREAAFEGERRLRLKANIFTLEMIGDRQLDQWEFVARAYTRNKVTSDFILQVGRKKLYTRSQQCFFWSSKTPPRRIQMLSPEYQVDFGKLSW